MPAAGKVVVAVALVGTVRFPSLSHPWSRAVRPQLLLYDEVSAWFGGVPDPQTKGSLYSSKATRGLVPKVEVKLWKKLTASAFGGSGPAVPNWTGGEAVGPNWQFGLVRWRSSTATMPSDVMALTSFWRSAWNCEALTGYGSPGQFCR